MGESDLIYVLGQLECSRFKDLSDETMALKKHDIF